MVELADTLDLGSSGRPWGFKSLQAHQQKVPERVFFIADKTGLKSKAIQKSCSPIFLERIIYRCYF